MSAAPTDLTVPRELGGLVSQALALYRGNARVFLTLAAAVVFPVELIWGGFGLGELTGGYREHLPDGLVVLDALLGVLVTTPLITAMHVTAVLDLASGTTPSVRRSAQVALDAFPAVLAAMVGYVAGVALGLLLLIVPGIWLAVRWYFVTQAVVVDGRRRGIDALQRSADLVDGNWWRLARIGVVFNLLMAPILVAGGAGVQAAARSADSGPLDLLGTAVIETVVLSFLALATTLVFFDLRLRHEGAGPGRAAGSGSDERGAGLR